ncbi:MAG: hypothetical protein H0U43_05805 [Chthoniobacterales bacterium]|nr:hypothetical protein [Chthoniobacterales bacterium]
MSAGCEEHPGHDAADDGAVEMLVVREVFQNWIGATAGERQLDRAPAKAAFQFIEVHVEPRARVADDGDRFRLELATRMRPKVLSIIKCRLVA